MTVILSNSQGQIQGKKPHAFERGFIYFWTASLESSDTGSNMFDKHFVSETLKGGRSAVQMGQPSEEKAESIHVKGFGKKMVEDHTKLGDQMNQVASKLYCASSKIDGSWLIRRLSPDSNPIDIQTLPKHGDEEMLLTVMGSETANVHLGKKAQARNISKDLKTRKRGWQQDAAERMAKVLEKNWKRNRKILIERVV